MRIHSLDHMRLSITTSADGAVDFVRILGDVDLSEAHALGLAARHLSDGDASLIYVDLGGTTFMGSTLVGFLVQLGNNGRASRALVLCRPTPAARRVIHMTGLDELASVRADLPALWPDDAGELEPAIGHISERWLAS
jgi:anti-anti-sigma factor